MRSSHLSPEDSAQDQVIRHLVADRAGREWCLFVDRDGVLNRQIVGDYVRNWRQFEWLPGAVAALKILRAWAPHLVVVTNQQGIGKGLMAEADVADIHERLRADLELHGVVIDAFQVCPHLVSDACGCRKPRVGLVVEWLDEHPQAEPQLSIMIGDSASDLALADNLSGEFGGCSSVQIGGVAAHGLSADATFTSLWQFAVAVDRARRAT